MPGTADSSNAVASSLPSPRTQSAGQPGQLGLLVGLAHGEDQADRFGGEPASHEFQHLRGGLVEPLRIVYDADQGLIFGHVGQQGQYRQAQQKAVWRAA